jgi:hypothetical protein
MARFQKVLILVALAISVSYNTVWIASARPLVEMVCAGERAQVELTAYEAFHEERWLDAADAFGYLASYRPSADSACLVSHQYRSAARLPFAALVLRAVRDPGAGDAMAREYREYYEKALDKLRAAHDTSLARLRNPN